MLVLSRKPEEVIVISDPENGRETSGFLKMAKTTAQRKAKERKLKKAHLKRMESEEVKVTMFKGTRQALEYLKEQGQFEQDSEAITFLIHNAEQLIKRDMSQKSMLLKVPTPAA